jgi:hypothetical protein
MQMHFQFENSSMLDHCSYDTDTDELTVVFVGGKSYTYQDVDRRIYDELTGAKSAGKYFNLIKKDLKVKK